MNNKSIPSLLIAILCSIGLVYQIEDVCQSYFSYATRSLIQMNLPLTMNIPDMSVCFRLEIILDRDRILFDKNITVPVAVKNWTAYYIEIAKLPIKDLMLYTPANDTILSKNGTACMVRIPGQFAFGYPYTQEEECYKMLKINKYMQRQYMCYRFHIDLKATKSIELLKHNETINDTKIGMKAGDVPTPANSDKRRASNRTLVIDETCLTPNFPGLIFNVWLDNGIFGSVNLFSAFSHGDETDPLFDSIFASSFESSFVNENAYPDIQITPKSMGIERLPAPYDTNCKVYDPFKSRYGKILHDVRKESATQLKLVPTFDHVHEPYEHPAISPFHVRNKTISAQLSNIINKHYIDDPECQIKYFVTNMRANLGTNVKFSLIWPQDNSLLIGYKPDKIFIDLIIYISSCVGLWFGATIMHSFHGSIWLVDTVVRYVKAQKEEPNEWTLVKTNSLQGRSFSVSNNNRRSPASKKMKLTATKSLPLSTSPKEDSGLTQLVNQRVDIKLANKSDVILRQTLRCVDKILKGFESRLNDKIKRKTQNQSLLVTD